MNQKTVFGIVALLTIAALAIAACGGAATAPAPTESAPATGAPAPTAAPTDVPTEAPTAVPEPVTIRMALLPVIDTLPVFVADQQGYFAANGIKIEYVPVASAAERDQVIISGGADGMLNDMISTILFNKDAVQVIAVATARTATPDYPQYRVLASAQSGITDVNGLKGVEIGISEGTVIAYTTDRLLQAEGFAPDEIKTVAVPKIPDRLALLGSGEIKAANLPDPVASLAIAGGAVVIIDDTKHPEYGYSLWTFSAAFVSEHPDTVKGFLAAITQASDDINADKTKWDTLLADNKLLPQPLQGNYTLPDYPTGAVPSEDQFNDVAAWATEKGILSTEVQYADSVNAGFLP
ncbi:MAG: hypothetical protein FJ030_08730 [Chloroflexi bacterium]|nr:hypothetical protein [Chloroflexota bacterium]